MQPRSFHHVHFGQVSWSRVHRRPTVLHGAVVPLRAAPAAGPGRPAEDEVGVEILAGHHPTSAWTNVRRLLTGRPAFFPW